MWFHVYIDNNPLTYIQENKLDASQIQWLSELALFYFTIKYQTGHSNKAADALSHCLFNPFFDFKSMTDSDEVEVISYSGGCEAIDQCLNNFKIPEDLKQKAHQLCGAAYSGRGGQGGNSQHIECCLHFLTSYT